MCNMNDPNFITKDPLMFNTSVVWYCLWTSKLAVIIESVAVVIAQSSCGF